MFESSFAAPPRGRHTRHDIFLAVLITALFHVFLGFLIYFGRFTVKIVPISKKEEVRDVVLVPPLTVTIPKVVGGRGLATEPGGALGAPGQPGPPKPAVKPEAAPEEAEAGPPGPPGATAGAALPTGAGAAIPSLSTKFQQSIAIRGRSELTIPLAPPGTPPGPPGISSPAPLPDFTKYSRGVTGGGGYGTGRGGVGTGGGGGGGRQRIGVSIPLKGFDLLPWATKVVDRLQLHWNLPSVLALPEKAKVSFIIVVKKSGELDSIEILEGTTVEVLDRAALEAIRASLPFPALPEDFPGDLLEMTIEFVYND
ncbi:MAG TPA: energy transducer TonB [Acidobacteriota bacterium]|nr:energy transducer TonB [Acidobacteriota bacterium]